MASVDQALEQAARWLRGARGLLIGAGAGMGVDSGLPDFRGPEGFWNAYPAYRHLGLDFYALATPHWFENDPEMAWGFYGHRRNLYRATVPHPGFAILRAWTDALPHGGFVFTSNVDHQFQRAGFAGDRICEIHGSVEWNQCRAGCGVFAAEAENLSIDDATMRARPPLPSCPRCGEPARPNILMFGDVACDWSRIREQKQRLTAWLRRVDALVIMELGAGTAVPTVRQTCEHFAAASGAPLIRINLREAQVPAHLNACSVPLGAREALERLQAILGRS